MPPSARMADCHPKLPHYAKGLCHACYVKKRNWGHRLDLDTFNIISTQQQHRCVFCREPKPLRVHFVDDRPQWLWCRACSSFAFSLGRLRTSYRLDWAALERAAKHLGQLEHLDWDAPTQWPPVYAPSSTESADICAEPIPTRPVRTNEPTPGCGWHYDEEGYKVADEVG